METESDKMFLYLERRIEILEKKMNSSYLTNCILAVSLIANVIFFTTHPYCGPRLVYT
jgi:hypothetical protein